jgi:hypothetical protein
LRRYPYYNLGTIAVYHEKVALCKQGDPHTKAKTGRQKAGNITTDKLP